MRERGLHEFYQDPERADALIWRRKTDRISRRGFLNGAGLSAMALAVGAHIPFARYMPAGLIPAALAQTNQGKLPAEKDLILLNERPINAETRAHHLDDLVTPIRYHFVRNNGNMSAIADKMDSTGFTLIIDGEVERRLELSLADLKRDFPTHTWNLQLECAGNGRKGFQPPTTGVQWTFGGIGCAQWTGVSLADVLKAAGVRPTAVYTAHHSADVHLSGNPALTPLSRGVPIAKAMNSYNLLAWEMNGEPVPAIHGFPLRLVVPGWPASASAKWLRRIEIRDRVHDGPGMREYSYRINRRPVRPGTDVPPEEMEIIESMPVKSIITMPETNTEVRVGQDLVVRGHAWAGDLTVRRVSLSYDFGQTWIDTRIDEPANPYAWQRWQAELRLPLQGYYEIWARATDTNGRSQPPVAPGWNPGGYLNNSVHRIAVTVV